MESKAAPAVVFVHGFLGFGEKKLPWTRVSYFRGVAEALSDLDITCYFPTLPAGGSIVERASALARFLESVAQEPLLLIGFSQGGLDSRYLIQRFDPRHRVCQLVTVGTPHRGSSLAEWMLQRPSAMNYLLRIVGRRGMADMRPAVCRRFNAEIPDRADVVYSSYAAARPPAEIPLVLRPWARRLARLEAGGNDSQVTVASAKWGRFKGVLRSDHWELLGWNIGRRNRPAAFDHTRFYRQLVSAMIADYYGASSPAGRGTAACSSIADAHQGTR